MFLGSYLFDGDPVVLLPAYDRMVAGFPPGAIELHVCVTRADGITVFDACPSRDVFDAFSRSDEFAAAVAGAGLPAPRVVPCGDVHRAEIREGSAR